jgi:hypothetical protein
MTNERQNLPSASNAEADLLCPGRHQAQAGLPDSASAYSEFGTNVHAFLKDRTLKLDAKEQDMADLVLEIEQRILFEWLGRDSIAEHGREVRFWNTPSGKKFNSAQLDAYWITDKKRALIADTKSLWGEHEESPSNLQLRDQAVLLWMARDVDEVICFINQPRVTHRPMLCIWTHDDLMKACDEMEARVKASLAPNAQRIPGEKQCKYCKAKLVCPEAKAEALAVVTSGAGHPAFDATKDNVENIVRNLTAESLSELLTRLPVAKWVFDAAETEAKNRLKDGRAVEGWTLAEPRILKPIIDSQTVYNRALKIGVPTDNFLTGCIEVKKGKLEDEVRAATTKKGKELAKEMDQILAGCLGEKVCEPSLKRVKQLKEAA